MFYIEGPGHGGQVMVSNSCQMDLTLSYTNHSDEAGVQTIMLKIFSFPGGIASHAAPRNSWFNSREGEGYHYHM